MGASAPSLSDSLLQPEDSLDDVEGGNAAAVARLQEQKMACADIERGVTLRLRELMMGRTDLFSRPPNSLVPPMFVAHQQKDYDSDASDFLGRLLPLRNSTLEFGNYLTETVIPSLCNFTPLTPIEVLMLRDAWRSRSVTGQQLVSATQKVFVERLEALLRDSKLHAEPVAKEHSLGGNASSTATAASKKSPRWRPVKPSEELATVKSTWLLPWLEAVTSWHHHLTDLPKPLAAASKAASEAGSTALMQLQNDVQSHNNFVRSSQMELISTYREVR